MQKQICNYVKERNDSNMKNELFEIITESYENGKITISEAQDYVNFVECVDFNDSDDVDTLTEMVDYESKESIG